MTPTSPNDHNAMPAGPSGSRPGWISWSAYGSVKRKAPHHFGTSNVAQTQDAGFLRSV